MTSVPSEGGYTAGRVQVHGLLRASFPVQLVQARVHKQERIRWSAWQREKSAVRVPGGDSRPMGTGSARTPGGKRVCEHQRSGSCSLSSSARTVSRVPAMQRHIQHIFGGKSRRGQSGDEQFVDHAIALFPDGGARGGGGMTGDDQPDAWASCHKGDVRAIIEGTGGPTFRMGADLDRRTRQNRLDRSQIQQPIVTTAPDEAQIHVQDNSEHCGVAIQPIQTCAAVRGLISPVQAGRTRKEVLESPCLPGTERRKETQHAWKARVCVKALMQSYRKIRTPRLKLDCLKSNRQMG